MESDEEQITNIPSSSSAKRILQKRKVRPVKRPRFIKPTPPSESTPSVSVTLRPEEVFDKADTEVQCKKIELRLAVSLPLEKESASDIINTPDVKDSGFGIMHPPGKQLESNFKKNLSEPNDDNDDGSVISVEQLSSNRIPNKGLLFAIKINN